MPTYPIVQERRMNRHQDVVLQQRILVRAIGRHGDIKWNGLAGPTNSRKKNSARPAAPGCVIAELPSRVCVK
jgi:hypothetical protein